MGGLGKVRLAPDNATPRWPWTIAVASPQPVIACLGSQYAGWSLAHGAGEDAFFALGSGPARALAQKEAVFKDIGYRDEADVATLVIEGGRPPPPEIVESVARDCGVAPSALTVIYAPTQSLAGSAQVVARVLEVALHKAHELKFPLERIVDGMGAAPLSPPHPDFVTAMGRTNDAIIYGGRVQLFVTGPAADAKALAEALPSRASRDFGAPFAEIFKRFNGDFYAIDPMLFSPAEVIVTAIESGESFHAGAVNLQIARCLLRLRPRRAVPPTAATILVVSDQRDWHARQMEAAFAAAGAHAARIDLAACDFDTRSPSGLALPFLGSTITGRGARPYDVGRLVRGDHQTPRRSARAGGSWSRRLERRARHRTLRRQVDDEFPARSRRRADAADLDDGIGERPRAPSSDAKRRAARWCSSPCSARRARACASFAGRKTCPRPEGVAGVYYLQRFQPNRERGLQGLSAVRPARPRRRRHDAPRLDLDHQRQAGRPTRGRRA